MSDGTHVATSHDAHDHLHRFPPKFHLINCSHSNPHLDPVYSTVPRSTIGHSRLCAWACFAYPYNQTKLWPSHRIGSQYQHAHFVSTSGHQPRCPVRLRHMETAHFLPETLSRNAALLSRQLPHHSNSIGFSTHLPRKAEEIYTSPSLSSPLHSGMKKDDPLPTGTP